MTATDVAEEGPRGNPDLGIAIPAMFEDACYVLGGLCALTSAREWERAAIVAAFVRLSPGRGRRHPELLNHESGVLSPQAFADLGLYGLRSQMTVTRYVRAWLAESGGRYPRPGQTVSLPVCPFPIGEPVACARVRTWRLRPDRQQSEVVAALRVLGDEVGPDFRHWVISNTVDGRREEVARLAEMAARSLLLLAASVREGSVEVDPMPF